MITAADTNVAIDILTGDARFAAASTSALRECLAQGRVVACDVVWAELSVAYRAEGDLRRVLEALGIEFDPVSSSAAWAAGSAFRQYRERGGGRERVAPDFLVGAHALRQADRLLTRDAAFVRRYFPGLSVLDPAEPPPS